MVKAESRAVPRSDLKVVEKAKTIRERLKKKGARCKISEEDIASGLDDAARLIHIVEEYFPVMRRFMIELTAVKESAVKGVGTALLELPEYPVFAEVPSARPPGMLRRLIILDNRMKLVDGDSGDDGLTVSSLSTGKGVGEHLCPTFSLAVIQGPRYKIVQIVFRKYGHHGVLIECRVFGGSWELLAPDTTSPHLDDRPLQDPKQPETREYRVRFWHRGSPVGEWSPVQSITLVP